jgi:hypothetical protein
LAHHQTPAASAASRQLDADNHQFRRKIFQEIICGGIESQRRKQLDERRRKLQVHSGKISIPGDLSIQQMAPRTSRDLPEKWGDPAATFPHFHDSGGNKLLQACL